MSMTNFLVFCMIKIKPSKCKATIKSQYKFMYINEPYVATVSSYHTYVAGKMLSNLREIKEMYRVD